MSDMQGVQTRANQKRHLVPKTASTEKYSALISPSRDRNEPIYNWHAFKHSYSKKLVEELVKEFGLTEDSWVLDPFSGGGTTLLACKELGINSQGFDILPFSVFLSNVKTRDYDVAALRKELKRFSVSVTKKRNPQLSLPEIGIVAKAFSKQRQRELLSIKEEVDRIKDSQTRDFFMLGLLSILEVVSNTAKAGGFLRIVKRNVPSKSIRPIFLAKIETMIEDVEKFKKNQTHGNVIAEAELSDSRQFHTERKFDAIITSPPYPNRHDYTRIYGLELIFGFVQSNAELKQIRYDTLRSHVEARKRFEVDDYATPVSVKRIIARIEKNGVNNSKVTEMIEGYFEDMFLSLQKMKESLKPGGKIALVVSNVRFAGVSVPVDQILASIGVQAGLRPETILTARYRGNSAQQMKTYARKPTRESIVIWERKKD
jgi:DNA modification methylase